MSTILNKPLSIDTLKSYISQLTPAQLPPALRQIKAPIAQWQFNLIDAGLNNQLWRISTPASKQQLICRASDPNHPLTRNSLHGLALQQQLSSSGISAKVHHQSQFNGMTLTLMDYIKGPQQSANRWSDKQRLIFAKQLAGLHQTDIKSQIDTPLAELDIGAHLQDYLLKLEGKIDKRPLSDYRVKVKEITEQIQQLNQTFSATGQKGICHNDLNRLNIVYSSANQKFVLLDWDEARIGDCFFDLAGFTVEHQLTQQQSHQWLEAYFNVRYQNQNQPIPFEPIPFKQVINKLTIYQQAYRLTCELWHHLHMPSPKSNISD